MTEEQKVLSIGLSQILSLVSGMLTEPIGQIWKINAMLERERNLLRNWDPVGIRTTCVYELLLGPGFKSQLDPQFLYRFFSLSEHSIKSNLAKNSSLMENKVYVKLSFSITSHNKYCYIHNTMYKYKLVTVHISIRTKKYTYLDRPVECQVVQRKLNYSPLRR